MAAGQRINVSLACEVCGRRNYATEKNRRNTPEKLTLLKYCRHCRRHTIHKETK